MPGVEIEETGVSQIAKDLPQTISMIEARNFEIRGFTDAGDLLRVDHSVQIDERISGNRVMRRLLKLTGLVQKAAEQF